MVGQIHHPASSSRPPSNAGGARGEASSAPDAGSVDPSSGEVVVDVEGRVRRPGVYHLKSGARAYEAIAMAGGAIRKSDTNGVNLAARLTDGVQIVVGQRPAGARGSGSAAEDSGPVSLSNATLEQLDKLDGIGPALAQRIIDWREHHGGFKSLADLDQVSGIGPAKLASLRSQVVP